MIPTDDLKKMVWRIDWSVLEPSEKDAGIQMRDILLHVADTVDDFDAALQLLDEAAELAIEDGTAPSRYTRWMKIALRDGLLTLEQFSKVTKLDFKNLWSVNSLVDHKTIKRSRKAFSERFPNIVDLRDTMAHRGGSVTRRDHVRHAISTTQTVSDLTFYADKDHKMYMIDQCKHRHYFAAHEDKIVSYELSQESLEFLYGNAKQILSSFDALVK